MFSIETAVIDLAEKRLSTTYDRSDVLIYDHFRRLLDFIHLLLSDPAVTLEFDTETQQILLQRVDTEIPLVITIPPHELAIAKMLITANKLKIGLLDCHPIYFTCQAKEHLEVDRRRIVMGDFIPLNAEVEHDFQEAFLFMERLGEVLEVIHNSRTGAITFFTASSGEVVIEVDHLLYPEIKQLTSGETVRIGAALSDPVSFHTRLGYFNTRTGRRLTGEQLGAAQLEPRRFELITEFLQGKNVAKTANEILVVEDLTTGNAVTAGVCAETELLMYSATGGVYQQFLPKHRERYFRELQPFISQDTIRGLLAPSNHLYLDPELPDQLFCVDLSGVVTRVGAEDNHFKALKGLAEGAVGILLKNVPDSTERILYTVVYDAHEGLIYDCQPGRYTTQAEAIAYVTKTSLAGEVEPVVFNVLTAQSTKSTGSTTAEKKRAEHGSLPRK